MRMQTQARREVATAIERIPEDRTTRKCALHAELMRHAREQVEFEERKRPGRRDDAIARLARLALRRFLRDAVAVLEAGTPHTMAR